MRVFNKTLRNVFLLLLLFYYIIVGILMRLYFSLCPSTWYSWKITELATRISGWVEFLSKSRTSLCINIYNFTPVESNSDESKFRLSRVNNTAFYISGPKLLFETTEISTRPNSTQQEWNYIYLYTTKNIRSLTLTFLPQAISHVYFTICQIN
jgi:uncharacterized protein involved in cysteine biosynthesis